MVFFNLSQINHYRIDFLPYYFHLWYSNTQNEQAYVYLRAYKASTYKLIQFLSLDNMYHSWWFIALLTLFTLNLICCTINRFPGFLRLIKQKDKDLDDQFIKTLPLKKNLRLKTFNEQSKGLLREVVQKSFHKPTTRQSSPDNLSLFAEKGKYTRLSFYITHLGIILIILGGNAGKPRLAGLHVSC